MSVLSWFFSYGVIELLIVVAAVASTVWMRRRRRARLANSDVNLHGFVRTEEVSIDPTTGIVQRVWFNPRTGERRYVAEKS